MLAKAESMPNLRVGLGGDHNLFSMNEGPIEPDAYFTCGDLVISYKESTGIVLSVSGYLPYFDTLPESKIAMPSDGVVANLFVGDLTGHKIFNIQELPLEVSKDRKILHAGKGSSDDWVKISDALIFGLKDEKIEDIFIKLDT
jgi:hypothetical protein